MTKEELKKVNKINHMINEIESAIIDLKSKEKNLKHMALAQLGSYGWERLIPKQITEQVYYLVLSALEEEKEKLEKEFEEL